MWLHTLHHAMSLLESSGTHEQRRRWLAGPRGCTSEQPQGRVRAVQRVRQKLAVQAAVKRTAQCTGGHWMQ